jgi:xanthine dehydrogenase iron-sulfur cluster and FAD-binding subunit A
MKPAAYIRVATVAEACLILAEHGADAAILAGGTDLLIKLRRLSAQTPKLIIDISRLSELSGIAERDGDLVIGPLATHTQLQRSGLVQRRAHLLASAAASIGAPQIRNRGTIGGNIMNAAACADTVPPLIALGATITLQSGAGARELNLGELFLKPYQTTANPDELLTAIRFPCLPATVRSAFVKLGRRNALSITRLSVAAILEIGADGRIDGARIVPGAAFPTWRRVTEAEQMLMGEKPAADLFAAVGRRVSAEMIRETGRRWSTEYKEPVLAVLVRRVLEQCAVAPVSRPASSSSTGTTEGGESVAPKGGRRKARASRECPVTVTINGRAHTLTIPARRTLLEVLRNDLGLTGTKGGCEIGECGACTVLLDGQPVNSCLVLAPQIAGREVTTVEGLVAAGRLHPLQESFLDHDAVHCGFCTPGMLLSAKALLDQNAHPTEAEIRTAISGNLCRCTGYQQIVDAIRLAAPRSRPEPRPAGEPAAT